MLLDKAHFLLLTPRGISELKKKEVNLAFDRILYFFSDSTQNVQFLGEMKILDLKVHQFFAV